MTTKPTACRRASSNDAATGVLCPTLTLPRADLWPAEEEAPFGADDQESLAADEDEYEEEYEDEDEEYEDEDEEGDEEEEEQPE